MKTSVYRFWGHNGELLYVGLSKNPFSRLGNHLQEKQMDKVSRITLEWVSDRATALCVEADEARWLHGLLSKSHTHANLAFADVASMPSSDPRARHRAMLQLAANVAKLFRKDWPLGCRIKCSSFMRSGKTTGSKKQTLLVRRLRNDQARHGRIT